LFLNRPVRNIPRTTGVAARVAIRPRSSSVKKKQPARLGDNRA